MDHPDKPTRCSWAGAGEVQTVPDNPTSLVISDQENDPTGLLEQWTADAWIYAETDDLVDTN
jgi:hypothetical protein